MQLIDRPMTTIHKVCYPQDQNKMPLSLKLEFHSPTETGKLMPPKLLLFPKSIIFRSLGKIILYGRHRQETGKDHECQPLSVVLKESVGRLAVYLSIIRSRNNFTFSWQYGVLSGRIWVLLAFCCCCFYHSVFTTQNLIHAC